MHTKDARAHGETEQRLYALSVWEETPFYSERERAALTWTEAVTSIGRDHVPDQVYERARSHFGEKQLVDLTMAVIAINGVEPAPHKLPHGAGQLPSAARWQETTCCDRSSRPDSLGGESRPCPSPRRACWGRRRNGRDLRRRR